MSKAGKYILEGLNEALAIVKGEMVLLHGFMKKSQKTPASDIDLARKRMKELE